MVDTVFGLPLHPLAVHATVVALPVAALTVAVAAVWPRFRRVGGALPLLLSLVSLALVPLAVTSGRSLADRVEQSALVEDHRALGEGLLPWVTVLALGAAGLYWWTRRERRAAQPAQPDQPDQSPLLRAVAAVVVVVALVGALGTTIQVVRVGHSGTEAVWSDAAPAPRHTGPVTAD